MTRTASAVTAEVPDFGISCGHEPPCTARFPFGGYDLLGIGYYAASPVWTYSATEQTWRCPTHSAPAPWFPAHDGERRLAPEQEAEIAAFWAEYEPEPPAAEPGPMPDLYDDGLPVSQTGTGDEWDAAALAAGNDQPDPFALIDATLADIGFGARTDDEVAAAARAHAAEMKARAEYEASQETGPLTRVIEAIRRPRWSR